MIRWKHGIAAALFGAGGICAGCGGEAERPEARAATIASSAPMSSPAPMSSSGTASSRAAQGARLATAHFSVEGMTCGGCVIATELAVKKLAGVSAGDAGFDRDPQRGHATVEYDRARVSVGAIADAIRRVGFTPRLRKPDQGAEASGRPDETE